MKLHREQKIAFARIITDLIESDFVVDIDEMNFFESIISKDCFAISEAMLIEAKKTDFSKALSILKGLDESSRILIINTLKKLSTSDGVCVPLEALLIFAIEQVLSHNATIHSIPHSGANIDNHTVIYIENEETQVGQQIEEKLPYIINEFKLFGFDFVYIPSIVQDYRKMDLDYLKKVVKYMIPSISSEQVSAICENLRGLTTSRFCRNLLYKKLGMNLIDCNPSLLIKINDSDIVNKYESEAVERIRYSNFLQLELKGNVLDEIHSILEMYHTMISCSITIENRPRTPKFIYKGFHRSLFDLIAFDRDYKEYQLVFEILNHKANIYFESTDDNRDRIVLKFNPQEATLYYMIVQKSISGNGLDWREHIPDKDKKHLLAEYNSIYSKIGKANTVTEYKDRSQIHHIKNRIRTLRNIANMEMFLPEHYKSGNESYYRINANSKFVFLKGFTTL